MMAGKLDRRITLRAPTTAQDAAGQQVDTMGDLATVWANEFPLRGQEGFAASQKYGEVTTRFRIRYLPDITVRNAIVYDGRTYDIRAVLPIGRRVGLEIYASARAE